MEFLIKDYLVLIRPESADEIRRTFLGPCIQKFVEDPKVRTCAQRATWLGNDETHYVREWTNKDLADLKRLIDLTVHWISSDLLTKEYESEMTKA